MADNYLTTINGKDKKYITPGNIIHDILFFDPQLDLATSNVYLILNQEKIFIRDIISWTPINDF